MWHTCVPAQRGLRCARLGAAPAIRAHDPSLIHSGRQNEARPQSICEYRERAKVFELQLTLSESIGGQSFYYPWPSDRCRAEDERACVARCACGRPLRGAQFFSGPALQESATRAHAPREAAGQRCAEQQSDPRCGSQSATKSRALKSLQRLHLLSSLERHWAPHSTEDHLLEFDDATELWPAETAPSWIRCGSMVSSCRGRAAAQFHGRSLARSRMPLADLAAPCGVALLSWLGAGERVSTAAGARRRGGAKSIHAL